MGLAILSQSALGSGEDEPIDPCQKTLELMAAFGRKDIKTILKSLDENIVWEQNNLSMGPSGRYVGFKQAVDLFQRLADAGEVTMKPKASLIHCDKARETVWMQTESSMKNGVTGSEGSYVEHHIVEWRRGKAVHVRAFHKDSQSKDSMLEISTPTAERLAEALLKAWFSQRSEKANELLGITTKDSKETKITYDGAHYVPGRGSYASWQEFESEVLHQWDFELSSYKPKFSNNEACLMEMKFKSFVYAKSDRSMLQDDGSTRLYVYVKVDPKDTSKLASVEFFFVPDQRPLTFVATPTRLSPSNVIRDLLKSAN